LNTLKEKKEKN